MVERQVSRRRASPWSLEPRQLRLQGHATRSTRRWFWSWPAASTSMRRENLIALGNSGTGIRPASPSMFQSGGRDRRACSVGLITAAALAPRTHRVPRRQAGAAVSRRSSPATSSRSSTKFGVFATLSKTGAKLLFEMFSQSYARGSTLVMFGPADRRMDRDSSSSDRLVSGRARAIGSPTMSNIFYAWTVASYRLNQSYSGVQTPTANWTGYPGHAMTQWAHRSLPRALSRQPVEGIAAYARGALP